MLMLNRAFFSLQSNWIPTLIALGNLALNAALDAAFYRLGTWGIPLATSVANVAAVVVLLALNLASERWSFSKVIERTPPLRWLDAIGRK